MEAKTKREKKIEKDSKIYWYDRGKVEGRKEIRQELIDLLGLDDRYEFAKEDY